MLRRRHFVHYRTGLDCRASSSHAISFHSFHAVTLCTLCTKLGISECVASNKQLFEGTKGKAIIVGFQWES